jgi:two-component system, OmpR family, osmolarity sensor histidine kinase EnvZ
MRRLGLVWRVALIVIAALVAIQMIAAAAYFVQRGRATQSGFRLPLPDQIAAFVQLVERVPADQRPLVLRAANGSGLRVAIERQAPPEPDPVQRVQWIEAAVARYLDARDGRTVRAYYIGAPDGAERRRPGLEMFSRRPVRIVFPLASGGVLVAETVDELTVRVFGLPPGFWAGIIGFIVAAFALYAVVRETAPLARLARSVDRFGEAIEPVTVPERGAREVRALIGAFNRMQSRIAELVRDRTFMLAAISHDLRTYLTRLRLRVEMMPDDDMRGRATRDVEDMNALLEDALAFAGMSFNGTAREPVDIVEIVRHECAERAAAGGAVRAALPPECLIVAGEPAALARVVGNLIDNALKYGREADVSLAVRAGAVEIMVDDRGPGVPSGERQRIFKPFLRLDPSRNRERGGAGLGLAIARHLVERHGGTVTVEDRSGGGARFRVSLPLAALR